MIYEKNKHPKPVYHPKTANSNPSWRKSEKTAKTRIRPRKPGFRNSRFRANFSRLLSGKCASFHVRTYTHTSENLARASFGIYALGTFDSARVLTVTTVVKVEVSFRMCVYVLGGKTRELRPMVRSSFPK